MSLSLVAAACSRDGSHSVVGPTPVEGPEPAGNGGGSRAQYPSDGPAVVTYVIAKYPEYLRAGVSREERQRNMEFLRDRIIETGICGGMNLAWNLKRGVGPRSIDAIDWRHGQADINDVVDIARDWDNTSAPIALHWHVTAGPAGWDPFPAPRCG